MLGNPYTSSILHTSRGFRSKAPQSLQWVALPGVGTRWKHIFDRLNVGYHGMSLIKKKLNNDILCIIYTPLIRSNIQSNIVAIYMVCPQPMFLPNTFYFICNELVSVLWIINIFRYIFILCFIDNYSKYGKN